MADIHNRFKLGDVFQSSVQATPRLEVASGTAGWRGSTGVSASLSLYGGVRARRDVKSGDFSSSGISIYPIDPLDTHSIDKVKMVSGSYPSTGSIRMVKVRSSTYPSSTQLDAENWYEEHFSPIVGLYDYYSRIDEHYHTGSYDFYSLYLAQNAQFSSSAVWFSGSTLDSLETTPATFEARIKPVRVTSSFQDFTVMSQKERWRLAITGSTGKLVFSRWDSANGTYDQAVTSSIAITPGVWSHVAAVVGNGSASLYVNLSNVGASASLDGFAAIAGALTGSHLVVGATHVMKPGIRPDNGFRGFVYETRIWTSARSLTQLSASSYSTLASGIDSHLIHYGRFNDGPMSTRHGFSQGSGTFDHSSTAIHGQFQNMRTVLPVGPIWQPNDDRSFTTYKTKLSDARTMLKVVHVPSMFYGRQIATGSVVLTCNAYSGQGIIRTLRDDGRGGLYVSGSITKEIGLEEYRGVGWNKVGNVFYNEGLIVITEPSLLDFGEASLDFDSSKVDQLQIRMNGLSKTQVKTFSCRAGAGQLNCSQNPSFSRPDDNGTVTTDDDRLLMVDDSQTTWITSIAICNEENRIVAIAKLAQPIRKRPQDKINIRLRMDF